MAREELPAHLIEEVLSSCAKGLTPSLISPLDWLNSAQLVWFAGSLILFSMRSVLVGPPLEHAQKLLDTYKIKRELVELFARELDRLPETRRTSDLSESLRLLLSPPTGITEAWQKARASLISQPRVRHSVANVSPQRIQHTADREAIESLKQAAGLSDLVSFVMQHGLEKMERVANLGGKVRIGPNQFPGLYAIFKGCVARAGVTPEPELYLDSGMLNAYTFGTEQPYIVLHAGAVTMLSTPELEFILGHELGHIRFKHVLYLTLGRVLPSIVGQLPFGGLFGKGLEAAIAEWQRKAEHSADRMGLLVSQDPDAAYKVMVRLSGVPPALCHAVNIEAFLDQYNALDAIAEDKLGFFATVAKSSAQTHPWTVVRAHELRRWIDTGEYERLLTSSGSEPRASQSVARLEKKEFLPFECAVCATSVSPASTRCGTCGAPCAEQDRLRPCTRCGVVCRPSQKYCERCGHRHEKLEGL